MPSADDVYITPADRKIDFYQSSAIAASISGSAADDLVLYTNGNSDQLVLDNGGNVGIGTNAPGETLHIVGTGRFTSSVAVGNTTQPTSTGLSVSTTIQVAERSSAPSHIDTWGVLWVKNDDPTNLYFTDDDGNDIALTNNGSPAGGGDIGGTVGAGYIPYASSGDTLANALLFTSGATESMYLGATPGTLNAANYNTTLGYQAGDDMTEGDENTLIGQMAGMNVTTGDANTAIGRAAGTFMTTQINNTYVGSQAGYSAAGQYNTFLGALAGYNTSSDLGNMNIFVGFGAAQNMQGAAERNIAIGTYAMFSDTDATSSTAHNIAIGHESMKEISTGYNNIAIGRETLLNAKSGYNNVAVGYNSLYSITSGEENIGIGKDAGRAITTGTQNTLLGDEAGENLIGGGYNVAIGSDALKTSTAANYSIAIGKNAMSSGDVTASRFTIGIGYAALQNATSAGESVMIGAYAGDAITTGGDNVGVGHAALSTIAGGVGNTAVGREAMRDIAAGGNYNTGIGMGVFGYGGGTQVGNVGAGWGAGYYPTGNYNVFMGFKAGYGDSTTKGAHENIAIGSEALFSVTSADNNVAIGYQAAYDTTTGYSNISIGHHAGKDVTTANRNIFIGEEAGSGFTTGAEFNVVIGSGSMSANTQTGNHNVVILGGVNAKADLAETTIVGHLAGGGVSGSQCTFIGKSAGMSTNAGNDLTALGHGTLRYVTGSYNTAIGRGAMGDGAGDGGANVAIGVRSLQALTTGDRNVAVGNYGLSQLQTHNDNTTMGDEAGKYIYSSNNTIIGSRAGEKLDGDTNGSGCNTIVGAWAGRGDSNLFYGGYNVIVGAYAMNSNSLSSARNNVVLGHKAASGSTSMVDNVVIGDKAGMSMTSASYNTFIGHEAGYDVTTADESVYIGYNSGRVNNTNYNVFMGNGAGEYATGVGNSVVIGRQAMGAAAATGDDNVIIGYRAGYDLTDAHSNVFVGKFAAQNVTSDSREMVVIGFQALDSYTTNSSHGRFTLVGGYAGKNISSTSSEKNNYTGIGYMAGYNDKSDAQHQLFGSSAGYNLSGSSSEDGCTFVGSHSGYGDALGFIGNDTTGIGRGVFSDDARYSLREVFIGSRAGANYVSGSYNVAIGYDAMRYGGQASLGAVENTIVGREAGYNLGRHAAATGSVAIGKGAGANVSGGSKNVYIGFEAGPSSATATESNKLYINNAGSATPLIEGDFSTPEVTINGYFTVAGKNGDGTGDRIIRSDSSSLYIQSQDNLHLQAKDGIWLQPDDEGTAGKDVLIYNYRGGTEYVRFDGGTLRVGIGTVAPAYKLDVVGTTQLSGNSFISGNLDIESTKMIQSSTVDVAQMKDDTGFIMQDTMGIRNNVSTISEWMADLAGTTLEGNVVGYGKVQVIKTDTIDPGQLLGATALKLYLPTAVTGMEYIVTFGTEQSNLSGKGFSVDANGSELIYKGGTEGPVSFSKNTGESLHVSCFETGKWSVVAHT